MRIFTQSSNSVVESIEEFWHGFVDEDHVKSNHVTVTADDLPLICMYNTLQSGVFQLYAHLKLINQFSTNNLRQNKLGYNASTFEICLEWLLEFTTD
jgi:hypothetical protein